MEDDPHSDEEILEILKMKKVAVVGMSKNPDKAAHYVPKYLHDNGYDITPVNPNADVILKKQCYDEITDVPDDVDIVDVFRPSDQVMPIIKEAIKKKPKVIWLQEGIHNEEAEINFNNKYNGRRLSEIIFQPRFLQAIIAAAFAYAVMSFLMTATPLSMHVMEKMSLESTGIVLQFHLVAMFLPSLITGHLIKKFGHSNIIYVGVLFYVVTIILSLFEQTFANYMVALIFLGLGWNFLFISGTSLVVLTYKEEEKFRIQGINDLIVFSTMALASLSAGILLSLTSWTTMNLICIPFLVLIVYSTFRADILSKK